MVRLSRKASGEFAFLLCNEEKKPAACDGPPYYYKVAYDEAERFLEKL
jgi:hypothetical protein